MEAQAPKSHPIAGPPAPPPTITTDTFISTLAHPDPARLGAIGIPGLPLGRFVELCHHAWYYVQPRTELRTTPQRIQPN